MKSLLQRGRDGENLADLDIVDMHGHFGRFSFPIADLSAGGLVAVMDRVGVRQILVSHMQCMGTNVRYGNDAVAEASRKTDGRILGYASVWPGDSDAATDEMQRCLDMGFVGLKLHNINGFSYTHDYYRGALSLANAHRMPLLLHTWGRESDFQQVRRIAEEFPEISILLAHSGSANVGDYIRVAREVPNAYLETAFSRSPRGLVRQLVEGAGADKVIWGSDCYFFSLSHQIGKVLGADVPDEAKRQVLSGNARRLLGRIRR